ncbi:F-box/RNI-like superfamily protein [Rhynchospora pubera]|uniref:F-box/RNI-like superfamily protein n=1 Tax=Rhynchospora pubera TaxID=906938 RepID=A0AAV8C665_9POAL|nr:F-box/RNI-like superfamily protein [Rhynchospora pubera]
MEAKYGDLISDLPGLVKEKILGHLPIKEAIRTSILSSKWRHTWVSMPEIVIRNEDCLTCTKNEELILSTKFIQFMDWVFGVHNGSILKFSICSDHFSSKAVNRWILNLSRKQVQQIFICLDRYKMPSGFFMSHTLTHVYLEKCTVILPAKFNGFKMLQELGMKFCIISEDHFEKLVSSSPHLENLSLELFNNFYMMRICSRNLRKFDFWGEFKSIHLDAPRLASVCIRKFIPTYDMRNGSLVNNLESLKEVEILEINKHFVMDLAKGGPINKFPIKFEKLKQIKIEINVEDPKEVALALNLFRSAPLLEHVRIKAYSGRAIASVVSACSSSAATGNYLFEYLKTFAIFNLTVSESVLSLVHLVLISAPALKKVVLGKVDSSLLLNRLSQIEKLSKEAQIIVC